MLLLPSVESTFPQLKLHLNDTGSINFLPLPGLEEVFVCQIFFIDLLRPSIVLGMMAYISNPSI